MQKSTLKSNTVAELAEIIDEKARDFRAVAFGDRSASKSISTAQIRTKQCQPVSQMKADYHPEDSITKKFNHKQLDKMVSLINYLISSADKSCSRPAKSLEDEVSLKMYKTDKNTLIQYIGKLATHDFIQPSSTTFELRNQISSLKTQVTSLELQIYKLKSEKLLLTKQQRDLRALVDHRVLAKPQERYLNKVLSLLRLVAPDPIQLYVQNIKQQCKLLSRDHDKSVLTSLQIEQFAYEKEIVSKISATRQLDSYIQQQVVPLVADSHSGSRDITSALGLDMLLQQYYRLKAQTNHDQVQNLSRREVEELLRERIAQSEKQVNCLEKQRQETNQFLRRICRECLGQQGTEMLQVTGLLNMVQQQIQRQRDPTREGERRGDRIKESVTLNLKVCQKSNGVTNLQVLGVQLVQSHNDQELQSKMGKISELENELAILSRQNSSLRSQVDVTVQSLDQYQSATELLTLEIVSLKDNNKHLQMAQDLLRRQAQAMTQQLEHCRPYKLELERVVDVHQRWMKTWKEGQDKHEDRENQSLLMKQFIQEVEKQKHLLEMKLSNYMALVNRLLGKIVDISDLEGQSFDAVIEQAAERVMDWRRSRPLQTSNSAQSYQVAADQQPQDLFVADFQQQAEEKKSQRSELDEYLNFQDAPQEDIDFDSLYPQQYGSYTNGAPISSKQQIHEDGKLLDQVSLDVYHIPETTTSLYANHGFYSGGAYSLEGDVDVVERRLDKQTVSGSILLNSIFPNMGQHLDSESYKGVTYPKQTRPMDLAIDEPVKIESLMATYPPRSPSKHSSDNRNTKTWEQKQHHQEPNEPEGTTSQSGQFYF